MKHSSEHRNTRQRRAILEELMSTTDHPTAAQLHERLRKKMPKLSIGTVYRNLDVLHEMGLVKKLVHAGMETRFDGNTSPHLHIRCTVCGKVADVHDLPFPDIALVNDINGFKVTGYEFEWQGLCPECRSKEEKNTH